MVTVQKNIIIGQPCQAIWAILDDPVRCSGLHPNLKLLYCFESRLGGYERVFRWCLGGKTFEAGSHMLAYEGGRHLAYSTCGDLQARWHWWLESDGRQTHVSLTFDYKLPKAFAACDAEVIQQENTHMVEAQLANLKRAAGTAN